MHPIAYLFDTILSLYAFVILSWVILRWLIDFNILNRHSNIVSNISAFLERLSYPVLSYVRRYIPYVLGFDFSPLLILILINFLRYTLHYYFVFHR